MITSSPKLKQDYNITIGCMPECLDPLEKISIEDTEVYISLSDIEPDKELFNTKLYYWFPIDERGEWELETFQQFWQTIEDHWGKKIYVHCTAGVNRSRCMVYLFLRFRLRLPVDTIMEYFPVFPKFHPTFQNVKDIVYNNQTCGHIPLTMELQDLNMDMLNG